MNRRKCLQLLSGTALAGVGATLTPAVARAAPTTTTTTTPQSSSDGTALRAAGPLTPPAGTTWFGAMTNPERSSPDGTRFEVENLEAEIGRKLDIDHRFYPYDEPFNYLWDVRWDLQENRIPMVTWGAHDTWQLVDGSQDAWIRSQAQALKAVGGQFFLRFYHEPDADYRREQVHSPWAYIQAWRYVHNIFQEVGATNVAWVWCPTAWKFTQPDNDQQPPDFYPGGNYVDWIAADGYNWAPEKAGAEWRSFEEAFKKFYDWAITKDKPLMAAEYGVQEDTATPDPVRKGQWIDAARNVLKTRMSGFQAVVYFDTTMDRGKYKYVWNIRSSTASITRWAAMANDARFNPLKR